MCPAFLLWHVACSHGLPLQTQIATPCKRSFLSVPDIVDSKTRSRMMAGIRGKNTQPEIIIRRGLHARGFRFRIHDQRLPGKPDMVFSGRRAVILVNGCFWHGHDCHLFRWPSSRVEFWRRKISRTRIRDMEVRDALEAQGWRVLEIWECAMTGKTRHPIGEVLDMASTWLRLGVCSSEITGV